MGVAVVAPSPPPILEVRKIGYTHRISEPTDYVEIDDARARAAESLGSAVEFMLMTRQENGDLVGINFINSGSVTQWMDALEHMQKTLCEVAPQAAQQWLLKGIQDVIADLATMPAKNDDEILH